ncbi:unnamed protein product [Staurois parvus]|uniref:Uncharacterized protein n=1 Tax=Staurois parvus TaxID=386267 RepID=A0ABN9FV76_9NEOB|nr:unnamed protein product [Staurois parvus]
MVPPTDPGPSGSARVLEWSVRPWVQVTKQSLLPLYYLCKCLLIVLM